MNDVVIQTLTIILSMAALILGFYYFISKQMTAMETRMREDIRDSENRSRVESKNIADSVETAKSELRGEIVAAEERLRGEIKVVADSVETAKSELRGEIVAAEERLRGEIKVVAESVEKGDSNLAESVEKGDSDLSHRMDRMDDKISRLIQDVGVVQGAVLGIPTRAGSREPEPTATS